MFSLCYEIITLPVRVGKNTRKSLKSFIPDKNIFPFAGSDQYNFLTGNTVLHQPEVCSLLVVP